MFEQQLIVPVDASPWGMFTFEELRNGAVIIRKAMSDILNFF